MAVDVFDVGKFMPGDNFYGVFLGKREKARDICIAVDDGLWICASWPADSFPRIGLF